jgi:hypothetical protein
MPASTVRTGASFSLLLRLTESDKQEFRLLRNQRRRCTYKRKIEARSRNHCCRGKETSITHSDCVCSLSYPACKAHAPYYIVICGLSGSTIFFHGIS